MGAYRLFVGRSDRLYRLFCPLLDLPDFVTLLLRPNIFIDNQVLVRIFRWYRVTHTQCREGLYALPQKMIQPLWEIGRTLFLEGHKALPCTDTRPNAALESQTYIPILLQGAALVAVRHCRVTNFPSWVRTATRAAPRKWQRAIALGADAKGFIGFCWKKMEYVSRSIVVLTVEYLLNLY